LQTLASGKGLEGGKLRPGLELLATGRVSSIAACFGRSAPLFGSFVIGGLTDGNFTISEDATLLYSALTWNLPGIESADAEVGRLLDSVFELAEDETRQRIIEGLAVKVRFFFSKDILWRKY
jgi:hypothetical protein